MAQYKFEYRLRTMTVTKQIPCDKKKYNTEQNITLISQVYL